MKYNVDALKTIQLPQYSNSPNFMERFLDAIHDESSPILRAVNRRGIKQIDVDETMADGLTYFEENKKALSDEFFEDLRDAIGEDKTHLFCRTIKDHWYDGRTKRNSSIVNELKQSIKDYLIWIGSNKPIEEMVVNDDLGFVTASFSTEEIQAILKLNDQMLYKAISEWLDRHPNCDFMGRGDIFFRRGLSLPSLYNEGDPYREWDFINSYSIAFTAPEKFAQMVSGQHPAIVQSDCDFFAGRVLFFSPFIPDMPTGQLEVGVIPSLSPEPVHDQGEHGGIREYLLGDHPSLHFPEDTI